MSLESAFSDKHRVTGSLTAVRQERDRAADPDQGWTGALGGRGRKVTQRFSLLAAGRTACQDPGDAEKEKGPFW